MEGSAPEDYFETVTLNSGEKLKAHSKKYCTPPCAIHDPSNHVMKEWDLHWREDKAIFERICPHGIGHPDPDTVAYLEKTNPEYAKGIGIHGCDGCCVERTEAEEDRHLANEYNKGT